MLHSRQKIVLTLARSWLLFNGVYIAYRLGMFHRCLEHDNRASAIVSALCMLIVLSVCLWRFHWLEHTLRRLTPPLAIFAFVSQLITLQLYWASYMRWILSFAQRTGWLNWMAGDVQTAVFTALLFPLPYLAWCFVLGKIADALRELLSCLSGKEKLCCICWLVVTFGLVGFTYARTTVFYAAESGLGPRTYDVLFTLDSPMLVPPNDAFGFLQSGENDIRQPLFGLFSLPFHVLSQCASLLFPTSFTYCVVLAVSQNLFLCLAFALFLRALGLGAGATFSILALYSVSYPALLFLMAIEQYTLSLSWMFLLLAAVVRKRKEAPALFVLATGSLLTSGAWALSLVPWRRLLRGDWRALKPLAQSLNWLACLVLCSGQLPYCIFSALRIMRFSGGNTSLGYRLIQYVNYIATCFLPARGQLDQAAAVPAFHQIEVAVLNPWGLLLFALALVGFLLNRHSRGARICLGWIGFSLLLFVGAAYGLAEGSLVLYTLYFSWAFLLLICLGINRLLENRPALRYACYGLLVAALLAVNLPAMLELYRFGRLYYPV